LTASGRFAHRKEYVIDVGTEHHFELLYYEALDSFRREKGVGVRGHLFVMQKVQPQTSDAAREEL
jgi:predicted TPR repeat methyltransferase